MDKELDSSMDSGDHWVSSILKAARKDNPLVADGVFARLENLLGGQLSERDLNPTNIKDVATQLITDTVPTLLEPEETR